MQFGKRMQFGPSSERLARHIDQLELPSNVAIDWRWGLGEEILHLNVLPRGGGTTHATRIF